MGRGEKRDPDNGVNPVIKYLMFSFNFLFWLIGAGLITVGFWAFTEKNHFSHMGTKNIYDLVFDIAIVFIIIGIIIFIIAFAGCLGALRENICLLKFFSYLLGVVFLVEIVGATLAFVFSADVKVKVTEVIQDEGIVRYRDDQDLQNFIDWIQTTFKCCGVGEKGFKDWSLNPYFNCTAENVSPEKCAVPYSCCIKMDELEESIINTMCGFGVQELSYPEARKKIYTSGCVSAMLSKAEENLYIIGGVAIGLAAPQIIGIFLARILANQVEDQRDRWI